MSDFSAQQAFRQAQAHHRAGRLKQAEQIYRDILKAQPRNADALNLLGVISCLSGRPDVAADLIAQAIEANPTQAGFYCNLGNAFNQQGKLDKAIAAYRRALQADPKLADAHYNLGNTLRDQGRLDEAIVAYQRAIEVSPSYLDAYYNLGTVLYSQDRLDEAIIAYQRAIEINPDFAKAHTNLGAVFLDRNELDKAITACQRAIDANPSYIEAHHNLRKALSRQIVDWHFPMLADTPRNESYQRAIESAVNSSSRVLDIGTGSSLLALMAAKAGALEVVACETSKPLAEVAKQIVIDNDLSQIIRVVGKKSTALEVGVDIEQRATLILGEIFDVGLLGEGALATLRHALRNLATPDVRVIPKSASVYGALIEIPHLRVLNPISSVCGFDLSAFDRFRNPYAYRQLHLEHEPHQQLTEPFHVKKFDFRDIPPPASESNPHRLTLQEHAITDGTVHAIAFWYHLHLDDDIMLSTGKGGDLTHWGQAVQFFDKDRSVRQGEPIDITMYHSDTRMWFSA